MAAAVGSLMIRRILQTSGIIVSEEISFSGGLLSREGMSGSEEKAGLLVREVA